MGWGAEYLHWNELESVVDGSRCGWCGLQSACLAVAELCVSSNSKHIIFLNMLYRKRAGSPRSASLFLDLGSDMVQIVPNGKTNVGGYQLCTHCAARGNFRVACGIILFKNTASITASFHNVGGTLEWELNIELH